MPAQRTHRTTVEKPPRRRRAAAAATATLAAAGACNTLWAIDELAFDRVAATGGAGGAAGTGATAASGGNAGGPPTSSSTSTGTAASGGTTSSSSTGAGGMGAIGPDGGSGGSGGAVVWMLLDQLEVPVDGTLVVADYALEAGAQYELRAFGTYYCVGTDIECDVEYSNDPPVDVVSDLDVGIGIDVSTPGPALAPFWGAYNDLHEYTAEWVGSGEPITAKLFDPNYTNNYGGPLVVEIWGSP